MADADATRAATEIESELKHRDTGERPRMVGLSTSELRAILAALCLAKNRADATAREALAGLKRDWSHGPTILLRCGEMTARELRMAKAVAAAVLRDVAALRSSERDAALDEAWAAVMAALVNETRACQKRVLDAFRSVRARGERA